jgi:hypothetical protein
MYNIPCTKNKIAEGLIRLGKNIYSRHGCGNAYHRFAKISVVHKYGYTSTAFFLSVSLDKL